MVPHNTEKAVKKKISDFSPYAEMMPGVVIIHSLDPFTPVYMSSNGLSLIGIEEKDLKEIGADYHKRFFNNQDMEDFLVKFEKLLKNKDPEETFTFFQQVKLKAEKDWVWHLSSTRIFFQDSEGSPTHMVTIAIPISNLKHIPQKADRLLAENDFFRENFYKYESLSKRAKEILIRVAIGKSSAEIAEELHISTETVNTHRKKIKQKLDITTNYEFTSFAQAFDLI